MQNKTLSFDLYATSKKWLKKRYILIVVNYLMFIEKFDKPTKIYIPLMDKNGNSYKMLVKVGDYVYKGDKT